MKDTFRYVRKWLRYHEKNQGNYREHYFNNDS